MEPDVSIQITWPLAVHEAISGDFECVEPSHLLMAALRFAELNEEEIKSISSDNSVVQSLVNERDRVRSFLNNRRIEVPEKSTRVRRGLRKQIGRGDHPHDGNRVVHRSPKAREICAKAEETARKKDSRRWGTLHLLEMLLNSPVKEIENILVGAGIQAKAESDTPTLKVFGRDVVAPPPGEASPRERPEDIIKDSVCKVLFDNFISDSGKSIILIQKGGRSPKAVMAKLSQLFGSGNPALGTSAGRRLVEVDFETSAWEAVIEGSGKEMNDTISLLLSETSRAGDVTLFFTDFSQFFHLSVARDSQDLLKEAISRGILCICGIEERDYQTYISGDRNWKSLLRPVWIHDLEIPFQL